MQTSQSTQTHAETRAAAAAWDAAARWINDSAADLDRVKLLPLIEAVRKRDDGSGPGNSGLYQVREETAVYRAA